MPMQATCPRCGRTGSIPDRLAGASVKCPSCGTKFQAAAPELDLYGLDDEPETAAPLPAEPLSPVSGRKPSQKRKAKSNRRIDLYVKGALIGLALGIFGVIGSMAVLPPKRNPITAEEKAQALGAVAGNVVVLIAAPIVTAIVYHKRNS